MEVEESLGVPMPAPSQASRRATAIKLLWHRFREFAAKQGHKTQNQMAKLWGNNVTQQNISNALKKIGFSRKKTYGYQERDGCIPVLQVSI